MLQGICYKHLCYKRVCYQTSNLWTLLGLGFQSWESAWVYFHFFFWSFSVHWFCLSFLMPQACDGLFNWQGSLWKRRTQIQGEVKWDCATSLMMLRLVLGKYFVAKSLQQHPDFSHKIQFFEPNQTELNAYVVKWCFLNRHLLVLKASSYDLC